ncbi:MAG: diaminopimelate epimerase [Actinobacteria bacterium]|nr:diaminopimelate epimerase [Actinomycetota bacterium]
MMRLYKHHGLGNDFLVTFVDDLPGSPDALARRLCDRRTGVGADGLLFGLPGSGGNDLKMVLFNADGSRPEMSGNGIRCLAHAHSRRLLLGGVKIQIETDGGLREVEIDDDGDAVLASVDMGTVGDGPGIAEGLQDSLSGLLAATADVGNPHLVVCVPDLSKVDVVAGGSAYEAHYSEGMNVEFICKSQENVDVIDLLVWERGVGATQACGTGAVAAATRAYDWGLVGKQVTVRMPGGEVNVHVGDSASLIGPSIFVATIEVP